MDSILSCQRNARDAYLCGRYREAGSWFEQAAHAARDVSRFDMACSAFVKAANAYHLSGEPIRGLALLAEAMSVGSDQVSRHSMWEVRLTWFELRRCFQPELQSLRGHLDHLRSLAYQGGVSSAAVVLRLEAMLHRARGEHLLAVEGLERAWRYRDSFHFHPYLIAYGILYSLLALGEEQGVEQWSGVLESLSGIEREICPSWCDAQARLGLLRNDGLAAQRFVNQLQELVCHTQQPIWQRRALVLTVRAWLLSCPETDPACVDHPLWNRLSEPVEGTPEVFDRYDRVLLLVDIRIASIRWLLNIDPVDDLYYRKPQERSALRRLTRGFQDELDRRLHVFQRAVRRATPIATKLDTAFHCDWRQKELSGREERVRELMNHFLH